jgi:hypothetical protein
MRRPRAFWFADEHLAAHPQVGKEGHAIARRNPQVFSPAFGAIQLTSRDRGLEPSGTSRIAAHGTGMQYSRGRYHATRDVAFQASPDGLDLRKFRHRLMLAGRASRRRRFP